MNEFDLTTLDDWITQDRIDAALALALNVIYAIVILTIALFLSGWLRGRINALAANHPRLDPTLFSFLGNIAKYLILVLAIIFILSRFGIQTTSLVALIGAAGLAIGLALQGTLSNLAAGVMIVLFRPFRVGDFIEAGDESGTVREISLFSTELRTYDGLQVIVPNSDIWSSAITNYSTNPQRMIDLTVGVAYDTDLRQAREVLSGVLAADARILPDPPPFVKVKDLGDSAVTIHVRGWVNRADFFDTKCDVTEAVKTALDGAGIEIPFPTQTLVVDRDSGVADTGRKGSSQTGTPA